MLYHYVAADATGKMVEGDFEGNTLNDALRYLAGKELKPVSVQPVKSKTGNRRLGKITISDKVFLTKYLALMLKVGTDLLSAINILIADFDKPAMKDFLLEVRENLGRGEPFYSAFARHGDIFSPTFVNLVKAAESSGNLEKTFEDLSNSLEKDSELQSRIKAALIYPIILLIVSTGILTFLVTFALPKVANVFSQSGINPPFFSAIVFAVGLFVGGHILIIIPGLVFLVVGGTLFVRKTSVGKRAFEKTLSHLPVIKDIVVELAVQRMAATMSSLMRAGLPVVETITIAAETVGSRDFKAALLRIAHDGLEKGLTIGEAFRREEIFPKMVSNLVAISEKAGHLDEVLGTLSEFYAANVDSSVKALVSLLEPLMLLTMGLLVAIIALSIIVPIYQLTSSF